MLQITQIDYHTVLFGPALNKLHLPGNWNLMLGNCLILKEK